MEDRRESTPPSAEFAGTSTSASVSGRVNLPPLKSLVDTLPSFRQQPATAPGGTRHVKSATLEFGSGHQHHLHHHHGCPPPPLASDEPSNSTGGGSLNRLFAPPPSQAFVSVSRPRAGSPPLPHYGSAPLQAYSGRGGQPQTAVDSILGYQQQSRRHHGRQPKPQQQGLPRSSPSAVQMQTPMAMSHGRSPSNEFRRSQSPEVHHTRRYPHPSSGVSPSERTLYSSTSTSTSRGVGLASNRGYHQHSADHLTSGGGHQHPNDDPHFHPVPSSSSIQSRNLDLGRAGPSYLHPTSERVLPARGTGAHVLDPYHQAHPDTQRHSQRQDHGPYQAPTPPWTRQDFQTRGESSSSFDAASARSRQTSNASVFAPPFQQQPPPPPPTREPVAERTFTYEDAYNFVPTASTATNGWGTPVSSSTSSTDAATRLGAGDRAGGYRQPPLQVPEEEFPTSKRRRTDAPREIGSRLLLAGSSSIGHVSTPATTTLAPTVARQSEAMDVSRPEVDPSRPSPRQAVVALKRLVRHRSKEELSQVLHELTNEAQRAIQEGRALQKLQEFSLVVSEFAGICARNKGFLAPTPEEMEEISHLATLIYQMASDISVRAKAKKRLKEEGAALRPSLGTQLPTQAPVDVKPLTKEQKRAREDMERIRQKRSSAQKGIKSKYMKRNKKTQPPKKCSSCGIKETPEWRKGPDGPRTLCNACGLHYAKLMRNRTSGNEGRWVGSGSAPPIDIVTLRQVTGVGVQPQPQANAESGEFEIPGIYTNIPADRLLSGQYIPRNPWGTSPPIQTASASAALDVINEDREQDEDTDEEENEEENGRQIASTSKLPDGQLALRRDGEKMADVEDQRSLAVPTLHPSSKSHVQISGSGKKRKANEEEDELDEDEGAASAFKRPRKTSFDAIVPDSQATEPPMSPLERGPPSLGIGTSREPRPPTDSNHFGWKRAF